MKYLWAARFTLHNVVIRETLHFDGFSVKTHSGSNDKEPRVTVTYRFATETFDPNIYKRTKEKIERFLDIVCFNSSLAGVDLREIMTDFDLNLTNRLELHKLRQEVPAKGTFTFHYTGEWSKDFAPKSLNRSERLGKNSDSEVLFRVLRLLRLSLWESDEYERFSKAWKSFNAFYNHVYGKRRRSDSELRRIQLFAQRLLASNSKWLKSVVQEYSAPFPKPTPIRDYLTFILTSRNSSSLMNDLCKQNFTSERGINFSKKLEEAVKSANLEETTKNALSCIYIERNKVEHAEVYSEDERDLLYICSTFIQRIIAIAFNEFYFIQRP